MDPRWLLQQMRQRLAPVYGERLKGLVLYGSEARGEAEPDSDIDILVLLDGEFDLCKEIRRIVHNTYQLVLDIERPIHALPASIDDYQRQELPLYVEARKDGIAA